MTTATMLRNARSKVALYEHDARYDNLCFERNSQWEESSHEETKKDEKSAKPDHCWLCRDFIVKKPQPSFQYLAQN